MFAWNEPEDIKNEPECVPDRQRSVQRHGPDKPGCLYGQISRTTSMTVPSTHLMAATLRSPKSGRSGLPPQMLSTSACRSRMSTRGREEPFSRRYALRCDVSSR
jgi:hypothetical protein